MRNTELSSSGDAMSIGEVATRSGIASSALRFYEELGLIQSIRLASSDQKTSGSCAALRVISS